MRFLAASRLAFLILLKHFLVIRSRAASKKAGKHRVSFRPITNLCLESTPSLVKRLAHGHAMFRECFKFRPLPYQPLEAAIEFPLRGGLPRNQNGEIAEIGWAVPLHAAGNRHTDKVGEGDEGPHHQRR